MMLPEKESERLKLRKYVDLALNWGLVLMFFFPVFSFSEIKSSVDIVL